MKQFVGILGMALYGLVFRLIAEADVIEINSYTFLFVIPVLLTIIPFLFRGSSFYSSIWKAVFFPMIGVFVFLMLALVTRIEDFFCVLIIGFPYLLLSPVVGVLLYFLFRKNNDQIKRNMSSLLILPLVLGSIEKQIPKKSSRLCIEKSVVIDKSDRYIFNNLLEVPNLESNIQTNLGDFLGVPRPQFSTYDATQNIRRGIFENGLILYEQVESNITNRELVFSINVEKSDLSPSPTIEHVLKGKGVEFQSISYKLNKIDENTTELTLTTSFTINSNVTWYAKYWSNLVILDFESYILESLKSTLEKEK